MSHDGYTVEMELLKISFDKYCDDLEQVLRQSDIDIVQIQGTFKLLSRLNDDFEEESKKLVHSMVIAEKSKDSIAKVMDVSHKAIIRFSTIAYKIEQLLTSRIEKPSSVTSISRPKLNLPKIDFRKFGGEIKDWLQFWSLFQRIHNNDEMEDDDKFQYLIQATLPNSKARHLIESYPPTGDNYGKAIESLKSRFGRNDLLIEYYVRELLKLVLNNLSTKTSNLAQLYDKMESQLRALETLGVTTDNCAAMLYPLLESCLPEEILRTWQRNPEFSIGDPLKTRLKKLMEFLKCEVENEERISLATNFDMRRKKESESKPNVPSATGFLNQNLRCSFCHGQHQSNTCQEALKMSLDERKQRLLKNGCCYRCLRQGHLARKCIMFSRLKCLKCSGKHVPLMCQTEDSEKTSTYTKNPTSKPESLKVTEVTTGMSNQTYNHVFLQTLAVNIVHNDQTRRARALFDTGSQKSYILKRTAVDMQMEVVRTEDMVHALFGGYNTETVRHNCYEAQLNNLDRQYSCILEVYDQAVICGNIASIYDGCWYEEINKLGITPSDTKNGPIELLLGADVIGRLYTGSRHVLSCGLVLVETKLGWTVMGKALADNTASKYSCMIVTSMLVNDKMVADFWNLELLGIHDSVKELTREEMEKAAMEHFRSTVKQNDDSRYEVSLPWIENHPPLSTNFRIAKKRLDSLMIKLDKDGYREDYEKVLQEWLDEGIIEEISEEDCQYQGHYLPHRHVLNLDSTTTKLRPVFDASARENSQSLSLNQCLEKGKNLIELIPSILLRFRQYRYGVISDIRKAFLQISLNPYDTNFLKFLWYTSENKLRVFKHIRLVFGLTCSPFLLGAVIQHHLMTTLTENSENYTQEFLTTLCKSFYVDNSIISFDTEEEIVQFKENARNAMMEAKMDLRCWEYTEKQNNTNTTTNLTSVLGLQWNKGTDTLQVSLEGFKNVTIDEKLTKKMILSTVSRIFDIIGFISPALLIPKVLLQAACKLKLQWNAEVPAEIKKKFFDWFNEIQYLANVRVPRSLRPDVKEQCKHESLHLFCDASQDAYAAVIFLRVKTTYTTTLRMIQSKNRVAPIKSLSIPRMELLAATIGSRILASIRKEFSPDITVYCWSDSSTVLSWIHRNENWKPFVRNRIYEILNLTEREFWHHVPGELNPADLPSRGCLPSKLLKSNWWNGPSWLLEIEEKWPKQVFDVNEQVVSEEKLKGVVSLINHSQNCFPWLWDTFKNVGSYEAFIRKITWVRRFIRNFIIMKTKQFGPLYLDKNLSVEELEESEQVVIWNIQKDYFEKNPDTLKNFKTIEDEFGVIRIQTKISERDDIKTFTYPAILPGKYPVVQRLIQERHVKLMHAGTQTVLANLREEFWIVGGKKSVRAVISRCVICQRQHSKHLETVPASLPKDRVKDAAVFEIVGIDAAGPLISRDKGKLWILIFTCAIFRAVHFEVITSMSTDCFLLAFRRFISRRGRPTTVYSDNGTNFVGAENALANLDWERISRKGTVDRIKWKFNPPTAPWWGGWWESLIKTLKRLLRKVLGRTSFTFEELNTIVCDCESVVNRRPLLSLTESSDDWNTLTPSIFLQDMTENDVSDLDEVEAKDLRRRYRYRLKVRDELRRRFRNEYLSTLIMKMQKKLRTTIPKLGDLGLIEIDNAKRFEWPLARIEEVIPGKDGVIRLLRLKVPSGNHILRPAQRFYPLEIHDTEEVEAMKFLQKGKKDVTQKKNEENFENSLPEQDEKIISSCQENPDESDSKTVTRAGRTVKKPKRLNL